MNIQGPKVNIHNRFDVEVRDSVTGELKQRATGYNIVLNTMWTRICSGDHYFSYIQFGTGTGTPTADRTTLFSHLGDKSASLEEMVFAYPTSHLKKKVVLNPEEYVGSVITEVGIAYDSTDYHLVTHALLVDSEGSPISITKTATDVVTIYATVFSTLADTGEITLTGGVSNQLLEFLIDDDSMSFYAGLKAFPAGSMLGSVYCTKVPDAANKKIVISPTRLGTTIANGHATHVCVEDLFGMDIMDVAGFTGHAIVDVQFGTGDGVEDTFTLPSLNVDLTTVAVKENGVSAPATFKKVTSINHAYYSPAKDNNDAVAVSDNGDVVICANMYGNSYSEIRRKQADGTYSLQQKSFCSATNDAAISRDGTVFAIANNYGLAVWRITDDDRIAMADPVSKLSTYCYAVDVSGDGKVVAIGSSAASNNLGVYDITAGDILVRRANPTPIPSGDCYGLGLSDDGAVLAAAYTTGTPRITVYDWDGSAWTARANAPAITENVNACDISADGTVLTVGLDVSPYIQVFDYVDSAWVECVFDPEILEAITANNGTTISGDGNMVLAQTATTMNLYEREVGGAFIKCNNLEEIFVGVYGGNISKDKSALVIGRQENYPQIFDIEKRTTQVKFTTPPAANAALTASYTVEGIHKTEEFVVDIGFTIQFGEGE